MQALLNEWVDDQDEERAAEPVGVAVAAVRRLTPTVMMKKDTGGYKDTALDTLVGCGSCTRTPMDESRPMGFFIL